MDSKSFCRWQFNFVNFFLFATCGLLLFAPVVRAQYTEDVLQTFCSSGSQCTDGEVPNGGLIFDSKGNLYGTTGSGGNLSECDSAGCGLVFELSPPSSGSGTWTETVLYSFCSAPNCADGYSPSTSLTFDFEGNLYGTTPYGGQASGCKVGSCGVVFELSPPTGGSGSWVETVRYAFSGGNDGGEPEGGLIFDTKGNLYGTAKVGGSASDCSGNGCGVVFELSPPSGGSGPWTETVLHSFTGGRDGSTPWGGVIFDSKGNLYGTTEWGGNTSDCGGEGCGVVFELSPPSSGNGPWTEIVRYSFMAGSDGGHPIAGLIFDTSGNLYGTTFYGGDLPYCSGNGCGVVFELSPPGNGSGSWSEAVLHSFTDLNGDAEPEASLVFDSQGNLYGTTEGYLGPESTVFELSPPNTCSGPWTETVLYDFCALSKCADGDGPSGLTFDSLGNLYGAASAGGSETGSCYPNGCGVVFELSPNKPGDFSLSASPTSVTVAPGSGGTSAITSTITGSFDSAVALSACGQPAGVTVAFTPSSIAAPGSGTSSMEVTVASTTASGTYTIPVTGTGGGSTYRTTVSLTVGSFTLTNAPPDVYIEVGSTTTSKITIDVSGAFDAAVTLSASVIPAGVTTSFSPNPLPAPGGGTSTLTYTAATSTATGTYVITITGSGGGVTKTTTVSLHVLATAITTTSVLASSTNPSTGGQTVTFTCTITPASGPTVTGTATFYSGGTSIGAVAVNASGVAALKYADLVVGSHSVTCAYNGSSLDKTSTSAAITQTVNSEPTTTTLTSSPNPSTTSEAVTLTATVTAGNGATPVGTVSYYSGTTLLGNVSLSGGKATLSHTFTTAGTYSLTAKYTGSNYMTASTSAAVTQGVNASFEK